MGRMNAAYGSLTCLPGKFSYFSERDWYTCNDMRALMSEGQISVIAPHGFDAPCRQKWLTARYLLFMTRTLLCQHKQTAMRQDPAYAARE